MKCLCSRPAGACRLFGVLFSAFLLAIPSGAGARSGALHHDLSIVLHPAAARLEGSDTLTFEGKVPELLLNPAAQVQGVTRQGKPVPFRFAGGRLTVEGNPASPLTVRYAVRLADPVPEAPANTEDPSYGVAAAITPQGTFLGGGSGWYPEARQVAATFRLRVEAPAGTSAVTSGKRLESRTEGGRSFSSWEVKEPEEGLALAAGPYRITESKGPVPVYTYFYPQSASFAENYREAAGRYLALYRGLFGPYPFPKFAVAENFFPTGYGYPSWTLLGSAVVRLPFIVETSLGHEVAHSWWGNGVWVDLSRGNWSEGLTTYVADYLYEEKKSPAQAKEYRLKVLRDYAALVPTRGKEMALKDFVHRTTAAEQAIGYGKSAMVFHMARQRIGDTPFWRGLRTVAEEKMFKKASWDDFAETLGKSGKTDLQGFFRQWVDRPGAPVLTLEGVEHKRSPQGWTVRGTLRQSSPAYDLHVPLRLETVGKDVETVLHLQGESLPFELRSADAPVRLAVDPDAHIFRRLDPVEIPPTVNGIRGSDSLLVVLSDSLSPQGAEGARTLLAALGKETAHMRPENEVDREEMKGHDLLFIGLPANRSLLPPLPAPFQPGAKETVLQGRSYSGGGAAVFAALSHPVDSQRSAALFLPGSAKAAQQAGRKIPHYGKYSYLAFLDGTNVEKGIWPVTASPLLHSFRTDAPTKRRKP